MLIIINLYYFSQLKYASQINIYQHCGGYMVLILQIGDKSISTYEPSSKSTRL